LLPTMLFEQIIEILQCNILPHSKSSKKNVVIMKHFIISCNNNWRPMKVSFSVNHPLK